MTKIAVFILKDKDGKALLQHRSPDSPRFPGQWAIFGGHIEAGETPEAAVRREAMEELALDLDQIEFFGRYETESLYEVHVFCGRLTLALEELKRRQADGDGLGVFSAQEAEGLEMALSTRGILSDFFSKYGNQ